MQFIAAWTKSFMNMLTLLEKFCLHLLDAKRSFGGYRCIFPKAYFQEEKVAFFPLLADETTKVSIEKQLTICFSYIPERGDSVCKCFFAFLVISDLTGAGQAKQL